jgi:predicted TIM-barrel fold metal-dependent hydrolase
MGDMAKEDYLVRVAKDYFKATDQDFFRNFTPAEMLATMDEVGVEKAIITTDVRRPGDTVLEFVEKHPDRFAIGAQIDPTRLMKSVRALVSIHKDYPVVLARITPFYFDRPPTDPCYYPIYSKCVELDLPLTINTGIPGPPMPGECQNPMYLDRVCLDFPDLKLVMAHGADPWWGVAMRLMLKYRNLYLKTSAYLPKYLPPELIHFMNTRGQNKIIFASDHPALQMKRALEEAQKLDLREGVLDKYLYSNAARLFFGEKD